MLNLFEISKQYKTDSYVVDALKNVNIAFRQSEFVSILGPSGCGKTTMLNIIGGLDRYSSGDLQIDGVSTKKFKDRDWDTYRNKKIGFVFQSYNLIPHLSILGNVELALTIGGIKKKERKERAVEALRKVGLENVIKKKPNQLSGGQMQRVAIARAIVNNPEILLADEPTGALDIKTSTEVMEILKEISKERLVVMVTHNKELADQYSTRIINLLDGEVVGDSNPFSKEEQEKIVEEKKEETKPAKRTKKSAMGFLTALTLSFKNLFSKKGRTILTSFAGSIGIVGISLVLAISNGLNSYINRMQSDALGAYPLIVSAITVDMEAFTQFGEKEETGDVQNETAVPYNPNQQFIQFGHYNHLSTDFVDHVKDFEKNSKDADALNLIEYNYFTPLKILVKNDLNQVSLFKSTNSTSIMSGGYSDVFFPMLNNLDYVMSQYDLIYGSLPEKKAGEEFTREMVLIVGEGNKIGIDVLLSMGIVPEFDFETQKFVEVDFEKICAKEFKLLFNDDYYTPNSPNFNEITEFKKLDETSQTALLEAYNSASTTLKISGVIRIKEDAPATLLSPGVAFMGDLGAHYRANCEDSLIAKKQLEVFENGSSTFFDPFVATVAEVSMIPPFGSIEEVNQFLNSSYGYTISREEAFQLGIQQLGISEIPTGIYFYPKNFEGKDSVLEMIDSYNETAGENKQIVCMDSTGFLTNTLGQLINIVSYVLIAFAAISLVVSSIMIGIITYVSVIERRKEIGVLRSLGARKIDVMNVFNAETFIIGLLSGLLGGLISLILTFPINAIVGSFLPEIGAIASLQATHVLILTAVSVVLSMISGLIPARIASKKDPVVALRSE